MNANYNRVFLSAGQLSRRVQVPASRVFSAIASGAIQPDGRCLDSRQFVFDESRVPEIAQRLETLSHACEEIANA